MMVTVAVSWYPHIYIFFFFSKNVKFGNLINIKVAHLYTNIVLIVWVKRGVEYLALST